MSATEYAITITIAPETSQSLVQGGYSFCAFKAIATTVGGGGTPLYWIAMKGQATTISIRWATNYAAYVSPSEEIGDDIVAVPTASGSVFNVEAGGRGPVTDDGLPGAISILNTSSTPYTSGLATGANHNPSPFAAFPLFGYMMNAFAPIEQVILTFTSYPVRQRRAAERLYEQGLFIDFAAAPERECALRYDWNSGWSWDGGSWIRTIPPNTQLAPLLIRHARL